MSFPGCISGLGNFENIEDRSNHFTIGNTHFPVIYILLGHAFLFAGAISLCLRPVVLIYSETVLDLYYKSRICHLRNKACVVKVKKEGVFKLDLSNQEIRERSYV